MYPREEYNSLRCVSGIGFWILGRRVEMFRRSKGTGSSGIRLRQGQLFFPYHYLSSVLCLHPSQRFWDTFLGTLLKKLKLDGAPETKEGIGPRPTAYIREARP